MGIDRKGDDFFLIGRLGDEKNLEKIMKMIGGIWEKWELLKQGLKIEIRLGKSLGEIGKNWEKWELIKQGEKN